MKTPVCIIANAGSGKKAADTLRHLLEPLTEALGEAPVLRLIENGDALIAETERAADEGFGTIIAAGGDGTICAVASALAGRDGVDMGVIPMGTFNFFARGYDVPQTPEDAVAALLTGQPQPVAVAEVNGRVFLNNASLGLYPAILKEREAIYGRWGRSRFAAYWSVVRTISGFRHPLRMRVTVDGEARRTKSPMIFIAKSAYQLEQYGLQGADVVRNGQFAVFLAPDCGRWQLVRFAVKLALRQTRAPRDFDLLTGGDILIETPRPVNSVARDGERDRIPGPYRFRIRENALSVILPVAASTDDADSQKAA